MHDRQTIERYKLAVGDSVEYLSTTTPHVITIGTVTSIYIDEGAKILHSQMIIQPSSLVMFGLDDDDDEYRTTHQNLRIARV